eukprot:scpid18944/ scgid2748/ 
MLGSMKPSATQLPRSLSRYCLMLLFWQGIFWTRISTTASPLALDLRVTAWQPAGEGFPQDLIKLPDIAVRNTSRKVGVGHGSSESWNVSSPEEHTDRNDALIIGPDNMLASNLSRVKLVDTADVDRSDRMEPTAAANQVRRVPSESLPGLRVSPSAVPRPPAVLEHSKNTSLRGILDTSIVDHGKTRDSVDNMSWLGLAGGGVCFLLMASVIAILLVNKLRTTHGQKTMTQREELAKLSPYGGAHGLHPPVYSLPGLVHTTPSPALYESSHSAVVQPMSIPREGLVLAETRQLNSSDSGYHSNNEGTEPSPMAGSALPFSNTGMALNKVVSMSHIQNDSPVIDGRCVSQTPTIAPAMNQAELVNGSCDSSSFSSSSRMRLASFSTSVTSLGSMSSRLSSADIQSQALAFVREHCNLFDGPRLVDVINTDDLSRGEHHMLHYSGCHFQRDPMPSIESLFYDSHLAFATVTNEGLAPWTAHQCSDIIAVANLCGPVMQSIILTFDLHHKVKVTGGQTNLVIMNFDHEQEHWVVMKHVLTADVSSDGWEASTRVTTHGLYVVMETECDDSTILGCAVPTVETARIFAHGGTEGNDNGTHATTRPIEDSNPSSSLAMQRASLRATRLHGNLGHDDEDDDDDPWRNRYKNSVAGEPEVTWPRNALFTMHTLKHREAGGEVLVMYRMTLLHGRYRPDHYQLRRIRAEMDARHFSTEMKNIAQVQNLQQDHLIEVVFSHPCQGVSIPEHYSSRCIAAADLEAGSASDFYVLLELSKEPEDATISLRLIVNKVTGTGLRQGVSVYPYVTFPLPTCHDGPANSQTKGDDDATGRAATAIVSEEKVVEPIASTDDNESIISISVHGRVQRRCISTATSCASSVHTAFSVARVQQAAHIAGSGEAENVPVEESRQEANAVTSSTVAALVVAKPTAQPIHHTDLAHQDQIRLRGNQTPGHDLPVDMLYQGEQQGQAAHYQDNTSQRQGQHPAVQPQHNRHHPLRQFPGQEYQHEQQLCESHSGQHEQQLCESHSGQQPVIEQIHVAATLPSAASQPVQCSENSSGYLSADHDSDDLASSKSSVGNAPIAGCSDSGRHVLHTTGVLLQPEHSPRNGAASSAASASDPVRESEV